MPQSITVRLPDDMYEQLEHASEGQPYNIPKSEVIRTALEEHFMRQEAV